VQARAAFLLGALDGGDVVSDITIGPASAILGAQDVILSLSANALGLPVSFANVLRGVPLSTIVNASRLFAGSATDWAMTIHTQAYPLGLARCSLASFGFAASLSSAAAAAAGIPVLLPTSAVVTALLAADSQQGSFALVMSLEDNTGPFNGYPSVRALSLQGPATPLQAGGAHVALFSSPTYPVDITIANATSFAASVLSALSGAGLYANVSTVANPFGELRGTFAPVVVLPVDTLCAAASCQNGGSCSPRNGSFACACAAGFGGAFCELAGCASSPCLNGATCVQGSGNAVVCNCIPGFFGTRCESRRQPCDATPCGLGTCVPVSVSQYRCECLPQFTGSNCNRILSLAALSDSIERAFSCLATSSKEAAAGVNLDVPSTAQIGVFVSTIAVNNSDTAEVLFLIELTIAGAAPLTSELTLLHVHNITTAGDFDPLRSTGPALRDLRSGMVLGDTSVTLLNSTGRFRAAYRVPLRWVSDMIEGRTYINIHTSLNPRGEVRCNLAEQLLWAQMSEAAEVAGGVPVSSPTGASAAVSVNAPVATNGTGLGIVMWHVRPGSSYQGFPTAPTGLHLHGPALANGTAGILLALGTAFPVDYSATSLGTTTLQRALVDGRAYANLHTAANPNGQLRGQLVMSDPLRESTVSCGSVVCGNGGTCVGFAAGRFGCMCSDDFSGANCTTLRLDSSSIIAPTATAIATSEAVTFSEVSDAMTSTAGVVPVTTLVTSTLVSTLQVEPTGTIMLQSTSASNDETSHLVLPSSATMVPSTFVREATTEAAEQTTFVAVTSATEAATTALFEASTREFVTTIVAESSANAGPSSAEPSIFTMTPSVASPRLMSSVDVSASAGPKLTDSVLASEHAVTTATMLTTAGIVPVTSEVMVTSAVAIPTTTGDVPVTSAVMATIAAAIPTTTGDVPVTSAVFSTSAAAIATTSVQAEATKSAQTSIIRATTVDAAGTGVATGSTLQPFSTSSATASLSSAGPLASVTSQVPYAGVVATLTVDAALSDFAAGSPALQSVRCMWWSAPHGEAHEHFDAASVRYCRVD
jgi:hypothetical protein